MSSVQLDLDLGEPWGGKSPRLLTKAVLNFSFPRKPTGGPRPDGSVRSEESPAQRDPLQLEMFTWRDMQE